MIELQLDDCKTTPGAMDALMYSLKLKYCRLQYLSFTKMKIGADSLELLAEFIKTNNTLLGIDVSDNEFEIKHSSIFWNAFHENEITQIKHINFSGNRMRFGMDRSIV